jgi:ABC-type transporter Mla MlaB component
VTISTSHAITFVVYGPIGRDDLSGLYARVGRLLERNAPCQVADCSIARVDADALAVEALARLQLTARRHGCRIRLRDAPAELVQLVSFIGLSHALPA